MSSERIMSLPVDLGSKERVLLYFKKNEEGQVELSRVWDIDADYMPYSDYDAWGFTCELARDGTVELAETFCVPRTSTAYAELEEIMRHASDFYAKEAEAVLDCQRRLQEYEASLEEEVADLLGYESMGHVSEQLYVLAEGGDLNFSRWDRFRGDKPWRARLEGFVKTWDGFELYLNENVEGKSEFEVKVRLLARINTAGRNPAYEKALAREKSVFCLTEN